MKAAAQRFRERGFDHVSVDELMGEAGLTRGGFYKHFTSRDELVTKAVARAFEDGRVRLGQLIAAAAGPGLDAFLDVYLNEGHRDEPGQGCPVAALIGDVARTPPLRLCSWKISAPMPTGWAVSSAKPGRAAVPGEPPSSVP